MMKWIVVIASALSYAYVSFLHVRSDFAGFLAIIAILSAGYYYVYSTRHQLTWPEIWSMAIAFRMLFLLSTPQLSNDYYRFFWDGMMFSYGDNVYMNIPENNAGYCRSVEWPEQCETYLQSMNSASYYSPYPPVCQYIWALSEMFVRSIESKILVLRIIILIFELATVFLLRKVLARMQLEEKLAGIYALNPLIILEFTGNLHPEVFMLFFLVLAAFLYFNKRTAVSAASFGLAIASKFIPLIILPFLIPKLGLRRSFYFGLIAGLTVLALFIPFYDPIILNNIRQSVGLYFGQFHFNASFFYIIKETTDLLFSRDLRFDIAPILSILSTCFILILAFYKKLHLNFFDRLLFAFSIYFLFATTIHPWYIGIIVLIGTFTKYTFPLAWGQLVLLSYSHYMGGEMREHYVWIVLEYAILMSWMVYENRKQKRLGAGIS